MGRLNPIQRHPPEHWLEVKADVDLVTLEGPVANRRLGDLLEPLVQEIPNRTAARVGEATHRLRAKGESELSPDLFARGAIHVLMT